MGPVCGRMYISAASLSDNLDTFDLKIFADLYRAPLPNLPSIESLRQDEEKAKNEGKKLEGSAAIIPCPMLNCEVDLTKERLLHIADKRFRNEQISEGELPKICEAIQNPDAVTVKVEGEVRFYKQFETNSHYKMMVVIKHDPKDPRKWVLTAYKTSKIIKGEIIWLRSKKLKMLG